MPPTYVPFSRSRYFGQCLVGSCWTPWAVGDSLELADSSFTDQFASSTSSTRL
jgi:hypothetical protein